MGTSLHHLFFLTEGAALVFLPVTVTPAGTCLWRTSMCLSLLKYFLWQPGYLALAATLKIGSCKFFWTTFLLGT